MANRSESNQNTCLRVSEGWEGDQQPCQSERLTLAAGGSWGWGVAQLLPLGAVLSPACPPALHPPGCRERPGGGRHAPKGCRTLAFGVHSNLPASDPLELTLTWAGSCQGGDLLR